MPTKRQPCTRRPVSLTFEQRLDLCLGPRSSHAPSAFRSAADRRDAWFAHREELLGAVNPTTRPDAWWQYEAPEPRRRDEPERDQLARMDALTDDERTLVRRWAGATQPSRPAAADEESAESDDAADDHSD